MNEATIRAAIVTAIQTVANTGSVYDYERWISKTNDLLTLFKTTISGTDQLRGFVVTAEAGRFWEEQIIGFQGSGKTGTVLITYHYRVRGFLGVNDAAATEKTAVALAIAVRNALDASAALTSDKLEDPDPVVSGATVNYVMFCGVLCHYIEISVNPQEVV
jgi:hypothetical protein